MDDNKKSYIIKDMRDQLYDIVGTRIENVFNSFSKDDYATCFKEISSLKFLLSSQMSDNNLRFFNQVYDKIKICIDYSQTTDKGEYKKFIKYIEKIPKLITTYIELIFKEMSSQKIWLPTATRHDTFNAELMASNFGLEITKADKDERKEEIAKLSHKELMELLTKRHINEIYAKVVMNNVIQK